MSEVNEVKEPVSEVKEPMRRQFDPLEIQIFVNPRTITNPGFKPGPMKELRDDIRKHGLKQNLEVRLVEGKPRLIAGERRLRSITQLREENASCFNSETGTFAPASEVYATVPALVTECATEKDAMRAAVAENLLHEHLTEYELLQQLAALESSGHSRQEQAEMFGKSEAWVSQSHGLLTGNQKVLEALADGTLGRTQAIQFFKVPAEKVEAVLSHALEHAKMEFEFKDKELVENRKSIYDRIDSTEALIADAEEKGEVERVADLRKNMMKDEEEVQQQERRIKKHRSTGKRKPRPSIENIQSGMKDAEADNGVTRQMPMKNVRRIADKLTELLAGGEKLENTETGAEYSRREVKIVRDVLDCVLNRNKMKNPLEALDSKGDDEAVAA